MSDVVPREVLGLLFWFRFCHSTKSLADTNLSSAFVAMSDVGPREVLGLLFRLTALTAVRDTF